MHWIRTLWSCFLRTSDVPMVIMDQRRLKCCCCSNLNPNECRTSDCARPSNQTTMGDATTLMVLHLDLVLLLLTLAVSVGATSPKGFVSINCGGAGGWDPVTTLNWTTDHGYLQSEDGARASFSIFSSSQTDDRFDHEQRLRSAMIFELDWRSLYYKTAKLCYKLPLDGEYPSNVKSGLLPNYLVRATFPAGNWIHANERTCGNSNQPALVGTANSGFYFSVDGVAVMVVELDFLQPTTVELIISPLISTHLNICLTPVNLGCPLLAISLLELRPLSPQMQYVSPGHFLLLHTRSNLGGSSIRYPSDRYDRSWTSSSVPSHLKQYIRLENFTDVDLSGTLDAYHVPGEVWKTAWKATDASNVISLNFSKTCRSARPYLSSFSGLVVHSYFYDSPRNDSNSFSRFIVDMTDGESHNHKFSPTPWHTTLQTYGDLSNVTFSVSSIESSVYPPLINGFELYWRLKTNEYTFPSDVQAVNKILDILPRRQTDNSDPCVPTPFVWITCSNDWTAPRRVTGIQLKEQMTINYTRLFSELPSFHRLAHLLISDFLFTGSFPKPFASLDLTTLELVGSSWRARENTPGYRVHPRVLSLENLSGKSLRLINLHNNALDGLFPVEFKTFSNLQVVDLSENDLRGELKIDNNLPQALKTLSIERNQLQGTVPDSLWTSGSNLAYVNLAGNNFTGLNLTTWFNLVNQTKSLKVSGVRVLLEDNLINKVFPASIDSLKLETSKFDPKGAIFLAGNPWCDERQELRHLTIVQFLCRSSRDEYLESRGWINKSNPRSIKTSTLISVLVTGGFVMVLLICISAYFLWKLRQRNYELRQIQEALARERVKPPFFSYLDIRTATSGFSSACVLGKGGFGTVYKAQFPDGTVLAVKKLKVTEQSTSDFLREIVNIIGIKHRHLIQLKGCCVRDKQHRMLVYEYAENRSLAEALWKTEDAFVLTWYQRLTICLGVARGLAYLHEELQPLMVHRDIKPQNILLDQEYNAKIADFGLIRPSKTKDTQITSHIGGTRGYSPPEYLMEGVVSEKLDVYSFGVVLLEIFSGRPCIEVASSGDSVYIPSLALSLLEKGQLLDLVDQKLIGDFDSEEVELVMRLGLACCHRDPKQRPAMSQVVSSILKHTSRPVYIGEHPEKRERLQLYPLMEEELDSSAENVSEDLPLISSRATSSCRSLERENHSRGVI